MKLEKQLAQAYCDIYDTILLGMVSSLARRPGVVDVKVKEQPGASLAQLQAWQRTFGVQLPDDLVNFLKMCDGLSMVWSVYHNNKVVFRIPI